MKIEIGLLIDHRKAMVVMVSDEGEEVREITSHMEKHVRYSDNTSEGGSSGGCARSPVWESPE
jgi:anti-sigma regulatory factor (Ser/Thr protein kinase)